LTKADWLSCDWPFDMLRHLDGKIDDAAFMRFSVACCRRVWPLITDSRSRAVVEATEAYLAGRLTAEAAQPTLDEWDRAAEAGEVRDLAGGWTNEAIESVCGVGLGHAAQVAKACFESAGYAASEPLRAAGAPQPEITAAWLAAERAERLAQCALLREMFVYLPEGSRGQAERGAPPDGPSTAL
jgi:hypothetical protein